MDDGQIEVTYTKNIDGLLPLTTIEISVSQRLLLSFWNPAGQIFYSELLEPLPTPLATSLRIIPYDIRSIPDLPIAPTRIHLAIAFCELGTIEFEEDLLQKVRHLYSFLKEQASEVKRMKLGYSVDAVVRYHYCVRRLKVVMLEQMAGEQVIDNDAIRKCMQRVRRLVSFNRRNMTMWECWPCFQDFDESARVAQLPCRRPHLFHLECLSLWMQRSDLCPLCLDRAPALAVGT